MDLSEKQRNRLLLPLLLAILIAITFSPFLSNGFTHWDDSVHLTENPLIHSLSLTNIGKIFMTVRPHTIYIPLVTISFAIEHKIWGMNPFGYHATNLLLHIINAILVFTLIRCLFSQTGVAFFTSLLFALHPLRVESVVWITERKDLLFTFFFLLALLFYLGYLQKKTSSRYLLSLVMYSGAFLAKTTAIVLPFMLILLDYVVERKISRNRWLEKIPFIILFALFTMITASYLGDFLPEKTAQQSITIRKNLLWIVPFYLQKTIWPNRLAIRYPTDMQFFMPPLWLSLIFSLALIIGSYFLFQRNHREWIWGWSFFFIALLPTFGLIRHFIPVADRYSYLPAIGTAFIFVKIAAILINSTRNYRRILKPLICGTGILCLVILASISFQRRHVWENDLSLWNDVIQKYPMVPLAYNNRGNILSSQGRLDEAILDYSSAIRLLPGSADFYWNRGLVWLKLNKHEQGDSDFFTAILIDPTFFHQYYKLMMAIQGKLGLSTTREMGQRLIKTKPSTEILGVLAEICIRLQLWHDAENHLIEALRISPQSTEYVLSLKKIQEHIKRITPTN